MKNEIIIYQNKNTSTKIEVRIEDETVWLTQAQMVILFQSTKQNISLHINNVFKEGELSQDSVVKYSLTTASDGKRYKTKYYNLDVIISVGYRVKSIQGTQFRIWANNVLKDFLLKGYAINQRVDRIENDMHSMKKELGEIKFQLNTSLPADQGIFYEGQVFDAYVLVCDLIKSAHKSIVLIDNYIDESVLILLSKREKDVNATIYTKTITKQIELDIKKHNQQYPKIEVKKFEKSHDRFLIIDNEIVYHIGASLKDLGKNWVAFSKMEMQSIGMINKLGNDE
ncbi:MAG: RhuM family protein [Lentimicrobium sp.]|jgi:hypothetical protein|nr:RhuM family protein [Bacteroidales bacterium]MDY0343889.1 RhuM family protein [Lentimicrobium sp.]